MWKWNNMYVNLSKSKFTWKVNPISVLSYVTSYEDVDIPHAWPRADRRLATCASMFIQFHFHCRILVYKRDDCSECSAKGLLLTAIAPVHAAQS